MNIFRVFNTISYPLFIYLLLFSRRNLVESSGSSTKPKSGSDGSAKASTCRTNSSGSTNVKSGSGRSGSVATPATNLTGSSPSTPSARVGTGGTHTSANASGTGRGRGTPGSGVASAAISGGARTGGAAALTGGQPAGANANATAKGGSEAHRGGDGSQVTTPPSGGSDCQSGGGAPVTTPPTNESAQRGGSTTGGSTHTSHHGSASAPGSRNADGSSHRDGGSPPTNEGSGTSPTFGGGTQGSQTNDLMAKFDKLVGNELQPENYPKDFKFFKADPKDANNTVELNTSEYKVKHDVDEHIYVFNNGVNCTLIKRDTKDLWKYDSSKSDAKYPKGMNVENDLIFIYFGEYTEAYSKSTGEWKLSSTVKKDLSSLKVMVDSKPRDD